MVLDGMCGTRFSRSDVVVTSHKPGRAYSRTVGLAGSVRSACPVGLAGLTGLAEAEVDTEADTATHPETKTNEAATTVMTIMSVCKMNRTVDSLPL